MSIPAAGLDPDKPLSEEDLSTLLDLLHSVTHKWERIATYLKLNQGTIGIIRSRELDPEDKLLHVIRRWLTKTNPAPTVMALVDALKKPYIDEEKVALEIQKHFYPHSSSKKRIIATVTLHGNCHFFFSELA